MSKTIKKIYAFESLSEGIFSSIWKGTGEAFNSKNKSIEKILQKITELKKEGLEHIIKTEKSVKALPIENTPEYRFNVSNLRNAENVFASMKEQKITDLIKQTHKIINNNPKLQASFNSKLARIEANNIKEMSRLLAPYKSNEYLKDLNTKFEIISKEQKAKGDYYETYNDRKLELDKIIDMTNEDVSEFVDMSNQESYIILKKYSEQQLNKLKYGLRELVFNLDLEWKKAMSPIRKDIEKAKGSNDRDWLLDILEKQKIELIYYIKKPLERIKYKLSLVEKETRSRKYGNN